MSRYLFLLSIGPVQSFIAQARKSKDLYGGSRLLSHLVDSAINCLPDKENIVFPSLEIKSKPNRFIADVETDSPQKLGEDVGDGVRKRFENIAEEVFQNICCGKFKPGQFDKQIKDFLNITWVIVPYSESYQETYNRANDILGAVKSVRSFEQVPEEAITYKGNGQRLKGGRKCSICGERNALFYKPGIGGKIPAFMQADAIALDKDDLTAGEGLCAVCFTKRFWSNENFPSVAEVALMHIPRLLQKEDSAKFAEWNKLIDDYKDFITTNSGKMFNCELLYDENLTEHYLRKNGMTEIIGNLLELQNFQDKIASYLKSNGLRLNKYYAVVVADADNIGKWLSGEFLQSAEQGRLDCFHKNISKLLGGYADKMSAPGIENVFGKTMSQRGKDFRTGEAGYAGGDDLLAFVNVQYLLDVLREMRGNFPDFSNADFATKEQSSLSAGVVIAHYKIPLSAVIMEARKMEHSAKTKGERDCVGLSVMKHSGDTRQALLKWNPANTGLTTLNELVQLICEGNFSRSFINTLYSSFVRLTNDEGRFEVGNSRRIVRAELGRSLERACSLLNKDEKRRQVDEWRENLYKLYVENSMKNNMENFLSLLHIVDFLAREVKYVH